MVVLNSQTEDSCLLQDRLVGLAADLVGHLVQAIQGHTLQELL